MDTPSRPRPMRVNACQRCRKRKQKCDLKHPSCSNCESASVACLTYHSSKRADLPRAYISDLEAQVERLSQENRELFRQIAVSGQPSPIAPASTVPRNYQSHATADTGTPIGSDDHLHDLVTSVRSVVAESSGLPRYLGPSSGITLAKMVMASVRPDALARARRYSSIRPDGFHSPTNVAAAESCLPPRHAADHIVEVYFQYRTPHLPIVDRAQVSKALDNAYLCSNNDQASIESFQRDIYTTYMVLAIALCNVPNPSGGTNRVSQSEGCFRSAICQIENIITYSRSDLETLRAVLLLAQFVSMCPWQGSLWHVAGISMRLCLDMGLHLETEDHLLTTTPELLYERRLLWHCTYYFDRVLGVTLGRPFGVADESTQVPLPNPWTLSQISGQESVDLDVHHQRAHNHLLNMSRLESEIRHVQQSQSWPTRLASPKPNFAAWTLDIRPRLREWYDTIPSPEKAHPNSIFSSQDFWNAVYENTVLLLYRPQSNVRQLTVEALSKSYEAACNLIASIKVLQREGKLDVLWRWVHQLMLAGLTVVYGLWQSKEIRDRSPISSNIAVLQSCASTLSAMSEIFHGAAACRDVFEVLSATTIDWLITNSANVADGTRMDLEKQVQDLLLQLQTSRGSSNANDHNAYDLTSMLNTDNFGIGEMLNSAAQWPDDLDMNLGEFGLDHAMSESYM